MDFGFWINDIYEYISSIYKFHFIITPYIHKFSIRNGKTFAYFFEFIQMSMK